MPLIKRTVQPVHLSRGAAVAGTPNELECVTNHTLSNVIRQLSSLSNHAQDIFSELTEEVTSIFDRTRGLSERVDQLSKKVRQLDSSGEEVSLQDINTKKSFRSAVVKDQQIMSVNTRPTALISTYELCEAPPPLNKLNKFREDGKDSLKFYTDTTYFFELWQQNMLKSTEEAQKDGKRKRRHRPKKSQKEIRILDETREIYAQQKHGKEFTSQKQRERMAGFGHSAEVDRKVEVGKIQNGYTQNEVHERKPSPAQARSTKVRPHQPPPAPPSAKEQLPSLSIPPKEEIPVANDLPPLPPPSLPEPLDDDFLPAPPSPISSLPSSPRNFGEPPPPPIEGYGAIPTPPPPPADFKTTVDGTGSLSLADAIRNKQLKKVEVEQPPKETDARSDLLESIRIGITLRKVEKTEEAARKKTNFNDVQAIMDLAFNARRKAVEGEDDSSEEDEEYDDEWDDSEA